MLDCWSAAPPYRMNKERPIDDRATLILLLTSPPLSLKGRSRRSESKGQRVIFERYYASLLIVECKVGLGIAGLEPATIRLKAQCSTN